MEVLALLTRKPNINKELLDPTKVRSTNRSTKNQHLLDLYDLQDLSDL